MIRLLRRRKPAKRTTPVVEVPGTGITDLAAVLYRLAAAVPPQFRMTGAEWVMSPWWMHYAEQLGLDPALPGQAWLIGMPVRVDNCGGWPHVEPRIRAAARAAESGQGA